MRSSVSLIELDGDVSDIVSANSLSYGDIAPPKVKFSKIELTIISSVWKGYTFEDTKEFEEWFGYAIVGVPGLVIARLPSATWSGVKPSHRWCIFHEKSGYPITTMSFRTRREAWICASGIAEFNWDRSGDEIRADKDGVAMVLDRLTRCKEYDY